MPADKTRACFEMLLCRAADDGLRAAGVGDKRVGTGRRSNRRKSFDGGGDRKRDVDEVGAPDCGREIGCGFRHRTASESLFSRVGAVVADHRNAEERFSHGQSERAANQAGADDRDAAKGNCIGHRPQRHWPE